VPGLTTGELHTSFIRLEGPAGPKVPKKCRAFPERGPTFRDPAVRARGLPNPSVTGGPSGHGLLPGGRWKEASDVSDRFDASGPLGPARAGSGGRRPAGPWRRPGPPVARY